MTDWLALTPEAKSNMRAQAQVCFQKNFKVQTVTQNLLVALQDAAAPTLPAHTFVGSFFDRNKKVGAGQ